MTIHHTGPNDGDRGDLRNVGFQFSIATTEPREYCNTFICAIYLWYCPVYE